MNKKAFTLIELLAVIVIISLLVTIVGVSITSITKKSKDDLYKIQALAIKKAAQAWYADNMFSLENGEEKTLNLSELIDYGLDTEIINPKTGEVIKPKVGEETSNVKVIVANNNDDISYEIVIDGETYEE